MPFTPKPWKHASATQITTHARCALRWHTEKIQGHRSVPGPGAILGSAVHKVLERYQKDGTPPDGERAGQIAAAALHLLPDPAVVDNANVEQRFEIDEPGMVRKVIGYIDLVEPDKGRVRDYKTTSKADRAKTADQLRTDTQAIIYTRHAKKSMDCDDGILFNHTYLLTAGTPKAWEVEVRMSDEDCDTGWQWVLGRLDLMAADAVKTPKEVEPNLKACGDYGGCPYRGRCALLGHHTLGAFSSLFRPKTDKETTHMTLAEKLKAKRLAAAGKPDAPAQTEPQQTAAAVPAAGINPGDGYPMDKPAPAPQAKVANNEPCLPDGRTLKSIRKDEMVELHAAYKPKVIDAGLADAYCAKSTLPAKPTRTDVKNDLALLLDLLDGAPAAPAEPAKAATPVEEKTVAEPPAAAPAPTVEPEPAPAANGCTLYLGCKPLKEDSIYLHDFLLPFEQQVASIRNKNGQEALHHGLVDYNQGEALLALAVETGLDNGDSLPPHLVVLNRFTKGYGMTLEALLRRADRVVIGC